MFKSWSALRLSIWCRGEKWVAPYLYSAYTPLQGKRPFLNAFRCVICLFSVQQPSVSQGLLIHKVSRSHTTTHHNRQDSSGRVISSSQRPLPDNTQHSQQRNIDAPGGIRTPNVSTQAAADLRLRPRGHWDPCIAGPWIFLATKSRVGTAGNVEHLVVVQQTFYHICT